MGTKRTKSPYARQKDAGTISPSMSPENKIKDANKFSKLKRKAGMGEPESQKRVTYPSGISIPNQRKTFLFKKSVILLSNGNKGNWPPCMSVRTEFFSLRIESSAMKGGNGWAYIR